MNFSLSTRWNASRHRDGARMIDEIRDLGFVEVELGHDLRSDLVSGVRQAISAGTVRVGSVHNFCPVPLGYTRGSPDLYSPCATDAYEQESAVRNTRRTIEFASETGTGWVVMHGGRVEMADRTGELARRYLRGERAGSAGYDKLRMRQLLEREKKGRRHLAILRRFLETLLPKADALGCRLAIEIQPAWESVPTELEVFDLLTEFNSANLRYWHDLGHGQIRENLGFINHRRWLERLEPFLAGMHIHDVAAPLRDHLPPGQGDMDFTRFAWIASRILPRVLEPHPEITVPELMEGVCRLRRQWPQDKEPPTEEETCASS